MIVCLFLWPELSSRILALCFRCSHHRKTGDECNTVAIWLGEFNNVERPIHSHTSACGEGCISDGLVVGLELTT